MYEISISYPVFAFNGPIFNSRFISRHRLILELWNCSTCIWKFCTENTLQSNHTEHHKLNNQAKTPTTNKKCFLEGRLLIVNVWLHTQFSLFMVNRKSEIKALWLNNLRMIALKITLTVMFIQPMLRWRQSWTI
jgi:hypothetical protein